MNITTKRVFAIAATVIGAVAISLIIGFFPAAENEGGTTATSPVANSAKTDVPVDKAPEGTDYENMSKDDLLKVIEEKDAEIEELETKVEELTILAEQTTNSIVVPRPSSPSEGGEESSDDEETNVNPSSPSGNGGSTGNPDTSDTGL